MKYQVILNGRIIFENDNFVIFFDYLSTQPQLLKTVLYDLLHKSDKYILKISN